VHGRKKGKLNSDLAVKQLDAAASVRAAIVEHFVTQPIGKARGRFA
jgi:hypothetical protein